MGLEDNVNIDWEERIVCPFGNCYERGKYFACFTDMFKECFIYVQKYKKEEGTNCTQK